MIKFAREYLLRTEKIRYLIGKQPILKEFSLKVKLIYVLQSPTLISPGMPEMVIVYYCPLKTHDHIIPEAINLAQNEHSFF